MGRLTFWHDMTFVLTAQQHYLFSISITGNVFTQSDLSKAYYDCVSNDVIPGDRKILHAKALEWI